MVIKFWGVNGSIATPLNSVDYQERITQIVSLALKQNLINNKESINNFISELPPELTHTYHGNTACVELDINKNDIFIFDAGTGLRCMGNDALKRKTPYIYHLFLSHLHWDHIQGFPFFVPAYIPGNKIKIYGVHKNLQKIFEKQQNSKNFPIPLSGMAGNIEFIQLKESETISINDVKIKNIKLGHPGNSYGYRVEYKNKSFVYATDSEHKDLHSKSFKKFRDFFKDADAVVFDSQYTFIEACEKLDWGHSSVNVGVEIATPANIKKLILFHHEPTYSDKKMIKILETGNKYKNIYSKHHNVTNDFEILLSYDGLKIDL